MDKKTTDKAWASMREMLDREMPEKRGHRFGWWWFGLLLLLPVVGYGSWQWLKLPHSPKIHQETTSRQPYASLAPKTEQNNASRPESNTPTLSINDHSSSDYKASTAVQDNAKRDINAENRAAKPRSVLAEGNSYLTTIEKLPNLQTPEIIIAKTEEPVRDKLAIDLLPITPQSIELQEHRSFQRPLFAAAESPKPIKKASDKRWTFGATSSISTEQFNKINGFSTGITVDWKFARKWGLRTGAMYNIHTPQEKYRPVASVGSAAYRSNVDGGVILLDGNTGQEVTSMTGSNFYGDSLGSNVFIPVNRLQRLEVPLTVFWQPVRPLKIIAGLSLTRTLSAKADKQNYSGDYILKLSDQSAEDDASKLSSSELDNWSADATIGAGVRLGSSFELGLSAKMPLSKFPGLVKSNQVGINAGLADQSLGSTRKQNGPVFSLHGILFF
ncbi:MAG: outer membrane beta-barrel protein [Saprospiraceae bacterium]